jgi:hypothetical protein
MLKTLKLPAGNRQGGWFGKGFRLNEEIKKTEKPKFGTFDKVKDPLEILKEDINKEVRVVECCHGCGRFVQLPRNWNIGSGKIQMPCGKCTSKKHIDKDGKRIEKPVEKPIGKPVEVPVEKSEEELKNGL